MNGAECHATGISATYTQRLTVVALFHLCPVSSPPLPFVTSPVVGHMTLLYINYGHFSLVLHIQCPFVYTTDALHKGDTRLGGKLL